MVAGARPHGGRPEEGVARHEAWPRLTLFAVGSGAFICANLAVDSASYQAGHRDGDCILTINGEACHEKIYKPIDAHPGAAGRRHREAQGG